MEAKTRVRQDNSGGRCGEGSDSHRESRTRRTMSIYAMLTHDILCVWVGGHGTGGLKGVDASYICEHAVHSKHKGSYCVA